MLPLLAFASLLPLQVASPKAFSADLVKLLSAEWPANRTVTIVCHGHSVPAGYFKTPEVRSFDAYPHLLHRAIKEKFPKAVVNVIVTAIGGENSEQGAARFERDVLALRPDVVTMDYGLNDRRIGLDRAKASWTSMAEAALKTGAKVIFLTPTWDLGVDPQNPQDPLFQHASQIRDLASQLRVGVADSLAGFLRAHDGGASWESLMSQSNHPNREGHKIVLSALMPFFGIHDPE